MREIEVRLCLIVAQLLFLCNSQLHINGELAAQAFDGTYGDPPIHHVYDAFRNCQPQASASIHRRGSCGFLGKWLIYTGNKFLAHADSRIIHDKSQMRAAFAPFSLGCREGYLSAFIGEFNRVTQDIDQHLLQFHSVPYIIIIQHRIYDAFILHAFGCCLPIADGIDSIQKLLRWNLLILQQHLPALNPAHIQDIIDQ